MDGRRSPAQGRVPDERPDSWTPAVVGRPRWTTRKAPQLSAESNDSQSLSQSNASADDLKAIEKLGAAREMRKTEIAKVIVGQQEGPKLVKLTLNKG